MLSRLFIEGVWKVHVRCLEGGLKVSCWPLFVGVWRVSGGCLVSVLGLLVVSGVCWVVSGGCFRHFFRSGHFVPPPRHTGIQDPASNRVKLLIQ